MLCPFCYFPIIQHGTGEVTCSVCKAGLHVAIEIIHQPTEFWLAEPRRNLREGTIIPCHLCQGPLTIGKEKDHKCVKKTATSIPDCGHGYANKGNCPTCRGMMIKQSAS